MSKKEIAEKYYNLLVLYSDFVEHGFRKKHNTPDFSRLGLLDKISPKVQVTEKKFKTAAEPVMAGLSEKKKLIAELNQNILNCTNCGLHENSKKIPGIGNINSKILVLTLPPSADEEKDEMPLTLSSLEFFKKWVEAIKLNLADIYITSILKCPPKKNPVTRENIESCRNFFDRQIEILCPVIILTLGQLALSTARKKFVDLNKNHGELFYYNEIPVFPIFHPTDVLADTSLKKAVWDDLKKIRIFLNSKGI